MKFEEAEYIARIVEDNPFFFNSTIMNGHKEKDYFVIFFGNLEYGIINNTKYITFNSDATVGYRLETVEDFFKCWVNNGYISNEEAMFHRLSI